VTNSTGKVPRGFTRYYVLKLLSESELTGKEIIDLARERSGGVWSPSPGLIYPLLGRLVRDGLVEEVEGGRFRLTPEGLEELSRSEGFVRRVRRQLDLMERLGFSVVTAGRLIADEVFDGFERLSGVFWRRLREGSGEARRGWRQRYREFLLEELRRLDEEGLGAEE